MKLNEAVRCRFLELLKEKHDPISALHEKRSSEIYNRKYNKLLLRVRKAQGHP